jgi:vanillate O-demethylase monooxygenase subunit
MPNRTVNEDGKSMFLRNYWYAAAWSDEITRTPFRRHLLNEPVALYRLQSGAPAALADICAHRRAPLTTGLLCGDALQCGYHGFAYDSSGACIRIPGQATVPPSARVKAYPIVDRWQIAWLWMGDPSRADPALIPDAPWLDDPAWTAVRDRLHVKCSYELLRDNLLDTSHLTFVHKDTIGSPEVAEANIEVEVQDVRVRVARRLANVAPPPRFQRMRHFASNVDRWNVVDWRPPATIVVEGGVKPTGTDDPKRGVDTRIVNFITPETDRATHYFWADARNVALGDAEISRQIYEMDCAIFQEDIAILEAQQRNIDDFPDAPEVLGRIDAGVARAHQIHRRLLEGEAAR